MFKKGLKALHWCITFVLIQLLVTFQGIQSISQDRKLLAAFGSTKQVLQVQTIGEKGTLVFSCKTVAKTTEPPTSEDFVFSVTLLPSELSAFSSNFEKSGKDFKFGISGGVDNTPEKNEETYIKIWLIQICILIALFLTWFFTISNYIRTKLSKSATQKNGSPEPQVPINH